MVPGQHHVRMNMYIARSEGGTFTVVESLGRFAPDGHGYLVSGLSRRRNPPPRVPVLGQAPS
jgi:hypothetical protein